MGLACRPSRSCDENDELKGEMVAKRVDFTTKATEIFNEGVWAREGAKEPRFRLRISSAKSS